MVNYPENRFLETYMKLEENMAAFKETASRNLGSSLTQQQGLILP
jgi:hypothetical protein